MTTLDQLIESGEIDNNIIGLVKALNNIPGVTTIGSCGGHENPTKAQNPAGTFYVKFEVSKNKTGWMAIEFLAWAINDDYGRASGNTILVPRSYAPYMNVPGRMLSFVVEGLPGSDPQQLATFLAEVRDFYVPANKAYMFEKRDAERGKHIEEMRTQGIIN